MATPAPHLPSVPEGNLQQSLCLTHQRAAIGPCSRCGTFVCVECNVMGGLCPACQARTGAPPYFAVSLLKLALLSLCTFSLYEIYWLYQQWKRERVRSGESISPFWRAFFGNIFAFSLFGRIHQRAVNEEIPPGFSPNGLALVFFVLNLTYRLPGALWLISALSFVPLLPVQAAANRMNAKLAPGADPNRRFTAANVVALVLGGGLLLFSVIGSFAGD